MRTFRTLDQAKKDLQVLQEYVQLIEDYKPQDFFQKVIYLYALEGNIAMVASILNNQGYSLDGRELEPNDISKIITSKPQKDDLLHKRIRTLYMKKTLPSRKSSRVKSYLK